MRKVVSASRRTDLVAFFPEWLSGVIKRSEACVRGPSGRLYRVDLRPESVHTVVLWSKDFSNLLENRANLRESLQRYDQLYFLFTITGLGGSFIEGGVSKPSLTLSQLEPLVKLAGNPRRVSVRFDPVLYWEEGGRLKTNLLFFEQVAGKASSLGIKDVRFSFAQWYGKAVRRALKHNFSYLDPGEEEKISAGETLVRIALNWDLRLFSCSQDFLTKVPGIHPSACIDGRLLQALHPGNEPVSVARDKSQRKECRCTESRDIGSHAQSCPHSCLYCYANPRLE